MRLGFEHLVRRADARSRSELDEAPGKCTERVLYLEHTVRVDAKVLAPRSSVRYSLNDGDFRT